MKKALAIAAMSMLLTMGLAPSESHAFRGTPGPKWTNAPACQQPSWDGKGRGFFGRGYRDCWRR